MKFGIKKKVLDENIENILKKAGYILINSYHTGKVSFARRLTRDHYPRFHIYIEENNDIIIIDIHLDQKKTSYDNVNAHNAEYDTPIIKEEVQRLKKNILCNLQKK